MKKIIISSLALLSIVSCKTDFETDVKDIAVTSGEADFTTYVALGNSLTSGYRDGALYLDGQNESYPSMIAEQMKKAGGGEFTQPLMPNNIGGFKNIAGFNGKLTLQVVGGSLLPVASPAVAELDKLTGSYNNMGVPGAKSYHLVAPGYGSSAGNPYFVRFASSTTTSVLEDAKAKKPTFFSLWIGNNDVLGYATSGGVGKDQTGNKNLSAYGQYDITDPDILAGSIQQVLEGLKSAGATKGVIANIPNVTSVPFFTTVPARPLSTLTQEEVSQLNKAYVAYNAGLLVAKTNGLITEAEYKQRIISFSAKTSNGAVIIDEDLTDLSAHNIPSYRQTTSADYILLTTRAELLRGGGAKTALTDAQVLTEKEVQKVLTATTAYNAKIKELATKYNIAFVDANAKMVELGQNSGIRYNGVNYTASFVTGGSFSLDAVHLTGKGYAIIANEFIKAINAKYKSNLPQVNPNNYSGVKFP